MSGKRLAEWTIVEDITSIKKIDIILASIQEMSEKIDSLENKIDSPTKSESVDNKIDLLDDKSVERKLNTCWRKSYLATTPNLGLKFILNNDTMNNNKTNLIYKKTNMNKLD